MSDSLAPPWVLRFPFRLLGAVRTLLVGALLSLTPLTSLIVLGWLTRRMAATTTGHWGQETPAPGWLFGPRGQGWVGVLLGGLAANIRSGLVTVLGLAVWTLPFTLLWVGAWWAGWENSFNKGYEQAFVGPSIWFAGAAIALLALAHLPFALAHGAAEGRLSAFFEMARIRNVTWVAGWRGSALALFSVTLTLPLFAARALPVFIEEIVPGFAMLPGDQQQAIASTVNLAAAGWSFAVLLFLRTWAARIYAIAAPRAAIAKKRHLWVDHQASSIVASGRAPRRAAALLWLFLSMAIWAALIVQIVVAQFMNYDGWLWLTHPLYLLPWPG